jgi:1,4-alpha-glucan branching enzyme
MMATIPVKFIYLTGLKPSLFSNAKLVGSWDGWTNRVSMNGVSGDDGCPAFEATVSIDAGKVNEWLTWGVILDGPGFQGGWGINTETNDLGNSGRNRRFQLRAPGPVPQEERYYLIHSRWLGAQKFYKAGQKGPGIRFSVWAPNAKNVDVVMDTTFDQFDGSREPATDLTQNFATGTRAAISLPRNQICGGYVSDKGHGIHPAWGPFKMTHQGGGIWSTDSNDPGLSLFSKFDHSPYMYRVMKDDGTSTVYRTDLYSRCQIGYGADRPNSDFPYTGRTLDLDGSISCSVVVDPDQVAKEFLAPEWPEKKWVSDADFWKDEFVPGKPVPSKVEDLVIYELHIGALGFGKPVNKAGTLEDALNLLSYIEDLGVNAIELLPLSESGGGGGGWGYATSHYFAIEYAGGGRDNYKWFIKECHRRGIAVILDVVYNHYNHSAERSEWMFDTNTHSKNPYYWYEGRESDYPYFNDHVPPDQRGTGGYSDNMSTAWAPNYREEMVRKMFVSSAVALAIEFHVDGFRMDQTTSIHSYNVLHADGRQLGDANQFGQKLLRELTRTLRFVKPNIMLMAEDHSGWNMVSEPPDQGGLGFDAPWYADFYHHLIGDTDKGSDYAKLLKTAGFGDDRPMAMDFFAGALGASGSKKVVYHKSHDEAGNGQGTHRNIVDAVNGAPLIGDTRRFAEARCRVAAGITLLSAGTPMFLFGEEVGAEKDYLYGKVLENREDLVGLRNGAGKHLFDFHRETIRLRLAHAGLRGRQIDVVFVHNEHRLLIFRRWNEAEEFLVVCSFNNRPFNNPGYDFRADRIPSGRWREIFNSDAGMFGGDSLGNYGAELNTWPGFLHCIVPANAVVVLQRTG